MTDLNLQHDNHQDNVNKKMLKYVESIEHLIEVIEHEILHKILWEFSIPILSRWL